MQVCVGLLPACSSCREAMEELRWDGEPPTRCAWTPLLFGSCGVALLPLQSPSTRPSPAGRWPSSTLAAFSRTQPQPQPLAPNPPTSRAPSHRRGASPGVKDGWTQPRQAASSRINSFLPLPRLTPSKSDFAEHQRDAKSIYQVGLWALEKMAPGWPGGDRPEWHRSPHQAIARCQSLPRSQVAVPAGTWGSTTQKMGFLGFRDRGNSWETPWSLARCSYSATLTPP